jgi:hypothetical protein
MTTFTSFTDASEIDDVRVVVVHQEPSSLDLYVNIDGVSVLRVRRIGKLEIIADDLDVTYQGTKKP